MNFAQAQSRYDNSLPPDNDTTPGEKLDALLAEQVRTSLDPMDRLIAQYADALLESVEAINLVIIAAHNTKLRRGGSLDEWDIALSDGMYEDNASTFAIRELCMTGADDCQLGKLIRKVAQEAFAKRCVSDAEGRVL